MRDNELDETLVAKLAQAQVQRADARILGAKLDSASAQNAPPAQAAGGTTDIKGPYHAGSGPPGGEGRAQQVEHSTSEDAHREAQGRLANVSREAFEVDVVSRPRDSEAEKAAPITVDLEEFEAAKKR